MNSIIPALITFGSILIVCGTIVTVIIIVLKQKGDVEIDGDVKNRTGVIKIKSGKKDFQQADTSKLNLIISAVIDNYQEGLEMLYREKLINIYHNIIKHGDAAHLQIQEKHTDLLRRESGIRDVHNLDDYKHFDILNNNNINFVNNYIYNLIVEEDFSKLSLKEWEEYKRLHTSIILDENLRYAEKNSISTQKLKKDTISKEFEREFLSIIVESINEIFESSKTLEIKYREKFDKKLNEIYNIIDSNKLDWVTKEIFNVE